jgi:hypothetical protein
MLLTIIRTLISEFQSQRALAAENLALSHQLLVLQQAPRKPRLRATDHALWVLLSRIRLGWRESLTIVQPETVIRWHRLSGIPDPLEVEELARRAGQAESAAGGIGLAKMP